jgi:hypothetical protein
MGASSMKKFAGEVLYDGRLFVAGNREELVTTQRNFDDERSIHPLPSGEREG